MRNGKIARLPNPIRHQLNQRLQDNQPAKSILLWLNQLPEVRATLKSHFDSRPISKQNLSEWRHGGFRDWQIRQDALQLFNSVETKPSTDQDPVPDLTAEKLQRWLVLQYAAAANSLSALTEDPDAHWRRLRQFCADISRLSRAELFAQRLDLERQWLALDQSNSEARKEKQFWQWTKRPEVREKLAPKKSNDLAGLLEYSKLLGKLVQASGDRMNEPVAPEPTSSTPPPLQEEDNPTTAKPTPTPSKKDLPERIQSHDPATQPSSQPLAQPRPSNPVQPSPTSFMPEEHPSSVSIRQNQNAP